MLQSAAPTGGLPDITNDEARIASTVSFFAASSTRQQPAGSGFVPDGMEESSGRRGADRSHAVEHGSCGCWTRYGDTVAKSDAACRKDAAPPGVARGADRAAFGDPWPPCGEQLQHDRDHGWPKPECTVRAPLEPDPTLSQPAGAVGVHSGTVPPRIVTVCAAPQQSPQD